MDIEKRNAAITRIALRAHLARRAGKIADAERDEKNLDITISSIVHPIEKLDAEYARKAGKALAT